MFEWFLIRVSYQDKTPKVPDVKKHLLVYIAQLSLACLTEHDKLIG